MTVQLAPAPPRTDRKSRARVYFALTKPRIVELLLITTVPPMVVAERGLPPWWLVAATVVGGAMAAGGANAINMVCDRDIDAKMARTTRRPLVTGAVSVRAAVSFAVVLEIGAAMLLLLVAGWLPAMITMAGAAFYVFVYTLWLKRRTAKNIVIGGAAGAVPALVGWSAVTGDLSIAPWMMFLVVFCWTPPHFWALAMRHRDEYAEVAIPMLPVVASPRRTTTEMGMYTALTVLASLGVWRFAELSLFYGVTVVLFGVGFVLLVADLHLRPTDRRAGRVFSYSISYLTVVFVAMALDAAIF